MKPFLRRALTARLAERQFILRPTAVTNTDHISASLKCASVASTSGAKEFCKLQAVGFPEGHLCA